MKVYLSENLLQEIRTGKPGTIVLGTYCASEGVATVTEVVTATFETLDSQARAILSVLGEEKGHPLVIHSAEGNGVEVLDALCKPAEVVVYQTTDFFKRTPFNPEIMAHMKKERILIVGTGSVGAPMAVELAKAGVGTIIAVDKDVLEIHNCMRHVLGSSYIGWPKPIALQHYLREHVPACECIPLYGDFFKNDRQELRRLMDELRPTRILAVTDSLRIQYLCQRMALHYQIPMMAVWCDNNAVEGEIFLWEPGEARGWKEGFSRRGCYACLRNPEEATITRSSSFDYSTDDPDTYGGEPALGTFINRINNIAAIFMLAWILKTCPQQTKLASTLLDEKYEGNGRQYIRLGGPYLTPVEGRFSAEKAWLPKWYHAPRREDCSHCGNTQENSRVLFPEAIVPVSFDSWNGFEQVE